MKAGLSTRAWLLLMGTFALLLVAGLVLGEELLDRVERLRREGHYDLALAVLEDHVERGTPLTRELSWSKATLLTDADRFDRLSAELVGGQSAEDSLVQAIVLARAKEQFAQGRYLAALENLEALPSSAVARFPELPLFRGMALGATGRLRAARVAFSSVGESSPQTAMAQALLSDLSLRSGEAEEALNHADAALRADAHHVGPMALYARSTALRQMGEEEASSRSAEELLAQHPRSPEAAWIRDNARTSSSAPSSPDAEPGIAEVEAPARRMDFAIQFGAFHDRALALRMGGELRGQVPELRLERDLETSPPWYRVVGGSFPTRSAADAALARLEQDGHSGVVLTPGAP